MTDLIEKDDVIQGYREKAIEAKENIHAILNTAEYDIDQLLSIDDPKVLVLGTGPYFPEAKIFQEWSRENGKDISVDIVDYEIPLPDYLDLVFGLKNDSKFTMNTFESDFNMFSFDSRYDLVLLLRYCDLSKIPDDVYGKIVGCLNVNGTFLMSGGLNNNFLGYSLHGGNLRLEKAEKLPYLRNDIYQVYIGENSVINLRKE